MEIQIDIESYWILKTGFDFVNRITALRKDFPDFGRLHTAFSGGAAANVKNRIVAMRF
ncbi:hypothetical protein JZP41_000638 [Neisseria gonorrhoeae]